MDVFDKSGYFDGAVVVTKCDRVDSQSCLNTRMRANKFSLTCKCRRGRYRVKDFICFGWEGERGRGKGAAGEGTYKFFDKSD